MVKTNFPLATRPGALAQQGETEVFYYKYYAPSIGKDRLESIFTHSSFYSIRSKLFHLMKGRWTNQS